MKYPFKVYPFHDGEKTIWIADSTTLKGCTGQGNTAEESMAELAENETEWLNSAAEFGIEIPAVPVEEGSAFSGKFTVRVAPYVHREAAENAKKEKISLNQYISDAIVSQNARMSTVDYIAPEAKRIVSTIKQLLYDAQSTANKKANVYNINSFRDRNTPYVMSN